MSTETEKENKNMKNNPEEAKISNDENLDLMDETYKKFNSIIYTNTELNKFKDSILSLLKERDKIYMDKLIEYKKKAEKIKKEFDNTNNISNSKFSTIIDNQAQMSSRLDQLHNYETFVSKTNDKLISHEVRLNNMREDFTNATQKYDRIYLDNLELPGFIGRCAKYKNCQIFFLEVIQDLAKLNKYREKNIIDLKMYKEKLETIISSMNTILDNNNASQIKYINDTKDQILKDCNSMFDILRENMKEIRVDNSKYAIDLITQSMDLTKRWEKIEKIRDDLNEKFNYSVNKYQMLTDDTIKTFNEFKSEYGIIRRKFMELAEFIKDVRFRKNIGDDVKKKEIKVLVKKMLRKRKSFDGKQVELLSDISNIENIDFKKYYKMKNKSNNNEDNRCNSLKLSENNKSEINNYNYSRKNKKTYSASKEFNSKNDKNDLNQSAENSQHHRISINNPLTTINNENNNEDKDKDKDNIGRNINIVPMEMKNENNNNIEVYNSQSKSSKKDNYYNNSNHNNNRHDVKIKAELISSFKKNTDLQNLSSKKSIKEDKKIKDKIHKENSNEKNKDKANNDKYISETKNNVNISKSNKIHKEDKNQITNDKYNSNLKEEKYNSSKDMPHAKLFSKNNINEKEKDKDKDKGTKSEKKNEERYRERHQIKNNEQNSNSEEIYIQDNSKEEIKNICLKNNVDNKKDSINDNDNDNNNDKEKKELLIQNNNHNDKNKSKNDENSQISLNRMMSFKSNNTEIQPCLVDDSSFISESCNLNSAKNNRINNNLCLSSDKNISFIIENSNNNNINKFLINDIQLEHNDKVIKELASELEQSTAKKDKLASNQKEIESKFKTACSNIEPINLLGNKEMNLRLDSDSNEKNKIINKNEYQVQSINHKVENSNNNDNNNNSNDKALCNENMVPKVDNNVSNYENKSNEKTIKDKSENKIINDKYKETKVDNNNNEEKEKKIIENKNNSNSNKYEIQHHNRNYINNNNNNLNEIHQTKTSEEGENNYNTDNNNNYRNQNEIYHKNIIGENLNNNSNHLNSINKNMNDANINLNPIKTNNEICNNDVNKKIHAVDQKLLNLELYTKEKILDIIAQINLLKQNYKQPITETLMKEKSILDSSKLSNLHIKTQSNSKYKTLDNSFMSHLSITCHQSPFCLEKNKENIPINETNKNIYYINNKNNPTSQIIKRYPLKDVNTKSSLANSKILKNNSINNSINNTFFSNVKQNNNLTENNNAFIRSSVKMGTNKGIIDGNNPKVLQSINTGDTNCKVLKEIENKSETENVFKSNLSKYNEDLYNKSSNLNTNNNNINNGVSRNNFAFNNSSFNGAEIKLVDLNKLVNHQLPRNKFYPANINENDYFVPLNINKNN